MCVSLSRIHTYTRYILILLMITYILILSITTYRLLLTHAGGGAGGRTCSMQRGADVYVDTHTIDDYTHTRTIYHHLHILILSITTHTLIRTRAGGGAGGCTRCLERGALTRRNTGASRAAEQGDESKVEIYV